MSALFGPLSPTHDVAPPAPVAIRQAKAGRRGDPLSLLREGSSLLPPQNYSMRQYEAPPPWQLAGTGGYRRARDQSPGSKDGGEPDAGAGAGAGAAGGSKDMYRRVLDQQVREKELRRSYEKQQQAQEDQKEVGELPSYLNSHRGGGGDAPRGEGENPSPPQRGGEPVRHGHYAENDYAGMRPALEVSVPAAPQHGRRAQSGFAGGDGGGGGYPSTPPAPGGPRGNALGRIEEEKTVEQKLFEPTSPQHARFRLAHADPEAQAEMLRREEERKAMRKVLAAQIAEKQERKKIALQQDQKWDAEEYQREREQNREYNRVHGHPTDAQTDVQGAPQPPPPVQAHQPAPGPSVAAAADGTAQADDGQYNRQGQQWQEPSGRGDAGRWQAAPPGLYPNAAADAAYQPLQQGAGPMSARSGAVDYQPLNFGRTSGSQRSDSDALNLHYTGISGGSARGAEWDPAELFGGAARDSHDDLKSLCKELLLEQQGLRTQLTNQSNVVNQLRAAASRTGDNRRVHRAGVYPAQLQKPPPTGSSYSSRANVGPALGRRSRPSLGRQGPSPAVGGGPPSTAASLRSEQGRGAVSERREPGQWTGRRRDGGSSARHAQQPAPAVAEGWQPQEAADRQEHWNQGAQQPAAARPQPVPPKSPPIPTHRNRKPTEPAAAATAAANEPKSQPDPDPPPQPQADGAAPQADGVNT